MERKPVRPMAAVQTDEIRDVSGMDETAVSGRLGQDAPPFEIQRMRTGEMEWTIEFITKKRNNQGYF
jgi:hypothetical protein